jgi:hypothetical protein
VKNVTTVGVLGSLAVNVMLGLAVAAVFSVTPAGRAEAAQVQAAGTESAPCAAQPAAQPGAHAVPGGQGDYLVAARMGWAAA